MHRIPNGMLDCSIFLYSSAQSAKDGVRFGGSGFLVHVPSRHQGMIHVYAVTNKHVLDRGHYVLRLNTEDGLSEVIETRPDSWFLHPDGEDVAVAPIDVGGKPFRWYSIGSEQFMTREIFSDFDLGPGDDAFLIGRLVTLEGKQKNTPVVRFGNLSMPLGEIRAPDGQDREAFLVECRSLSGFSGSPVFLTTDRTYSSPYIPKSLGVSEQSQPSGGSVRVNMVSTSGTFGPWLLGVDYSHMPLWKPVYYWEQKTDNVLTDSETSYRVDANTGIACVVPAWRIAEILEDKELVKQRKADDSEIDV